MYCVERNNGLIQGESQVALFWVRAIIDKLYNSFINDCPWLGIMRQSTVGT